MKSFSQINSQKTADLYILVFNCGSSSLSYKIFRAKNFQRIELFAYGKAHRVEVKGTKKSFITYNYNGQTRKDVVPIGSHKEAAELIFDYIKKTTSGLTLSGTGSYTAAIYLPSPPS